MGLKYLSAKIAMTKNETQYEKYLRNGNEVFETYCSTGDKHPIMLPRAPQQKYVDLYPEDQPGCSFENDRNQQLNYEAEVIVYRALEKLSGEQFIVLHSFEYTHFQYYLGDTTHVKRRCTECKKRATNREGECDFVVIAPNYFVILEVKNTGHIEDQQSQALAKTFQKSLDQRNKIVQFVKRFCKRLTVLQFTVYPNFEKSSKEDFQLGRDQLSSIIFKEDLKNFSDWWKGNVSDLVLNEPLRPEFRTKHEDVKNLLLAIWCTDKKIFDKSKCSLGKCITKIDEQLRSGRFTFRSNNPEVIPSPKIVKDFLGIDNLTKQQYDLINSNEKFLWINGPAGAGKTVVLLAKMLQLALLSEDNKIVLFLETCDIDDEMKSEHLHKSLDKAGVKHLSIFDTEMDEKPADEIYLKIRSYLDENQVVIIMIRSVAYDRWALKLLGNISQSDTIRLFEGINVFYDDFHVLFEWNANCTRLENHNNEYGIPEALFELSHSCHVWISCDMLQSPLHKFKEEVIVRPNYRLAIFFDKLSSTQLVSLSKNLRNTSDLSRTLSVIREHMIEPGHVVSKFRNDFAILQAPGHYIHGPKTTAHVLQTFDKKLINTIIVKELNELFDDIMIDNNNVGILYSHFDTDTDNLLKSTLEDILFSKNISPRRVMSAYSKEWPVVIALQPFLDHNALRLTEKPPNSFVPELFYISMSRARVKCTVIMFPSLRHTILDDYRPLSTSPSLFYKLKDYVEVRHH